MASFDGNLPLRAPAAQIWDAVRDVGAVHERLAPGFVTDTKMDGDARIVTFGKRPRGARIDRRCRRCCAAAGVVGCRRAHDASQRIAAGIRGRRAQPHRLDRRPAAQ